MKKFISILIIMILSVITLSSLTSCKAPWNMKSEDYLAKLEVKDFVLTGNGIVDNQDIEIVFIDGLIVKSKNFLTFNAENEYYEYIGNKKITYIESNRSKDKFIKKEDSDTTKTITLKEFIFSLFIDNQEIINEKIGNLKYTFSVVIDKKKADFSINYFGNVKISIYEDGKLTGNIEIKSKKAKIKYPSDSQIIKGEEVYIDKLYSKNFSLTHKNSSNEQVKQKYNNGFKVYELITNTKDGITNNTEEYTRYGNEIEIFTRNNLDDKFTKITKNISEKGDYKTIFSVLGISVNIRSEEVIENGTFKFKVKDKLRNKNYSFAISDYTIKVVELNTDVTYEFISYDVAVEYPTADQIK